jgi:hypothetical protein
MGILSYMFWCGVLVWVYCLTCSDVESWYRYTVLHVLMWSPGMGILSYMFWCGVLVWVYCLTGSDVESWYGYTVLQVLMWSPGMGILSYFLLFAMFMNWVSGDCYLYILDYYWKVINKCRSRRGRDRMVVGSTTTCVISAYHL